MSTITIAVDIMGGDRGPHVFLSAINKAIQTFEHLNIIVCGDLANEQNYQKLCEQYPERINYQACEQVIAMTDKPAMAIRSKKQSSMRKALDLTQQDIAQGCVSSGNTGALMALAYYVLKTIPGVSRPALATLLPTQNNQKVLLLDLGASISYDAESLLQYAVMGSVFMQECYFLAKPRIALLNVGEEENKGNSLVKHADLLLKSCESLHYIGYVEGDDIFAGSSDVVVTDGFTGNVALKASEGIAKLLLHEIQSLSEKTLFARILSKLAMPLLKTLFQRMNPDQYNGASLLGLRSIVVKSHGNASTDACFYAIKQALIEAEQVVPEKIKTKIEQDLLEQ